MVFDLAWTNVAGRSGRKFAAIGEESARAKVDRGVIVTHQGER